MSDKPKILVFAGSTRKASWNKMLARAAAKAAEKGGGDVTFVDLADYTMPIYDGDFEDAEGIPENAKKLKQLFLANDALLIVTQEHNGAIPALLKNMIDWVSRRESADEPPLACYQNKVALLLSASPGALGGLRALRMLREILSGISVIVLPEQKAIPGVNKVFDAQGNVLDDKLVPALEKMSARLVEVTRKLNA